MSPVGPIGVHAGSTGALPTVPNAPVITGAVDGGDEDSIVVSVTGSDTIRLFYRLLLATSWTTGLTRSGSGDITQTGLTAGSWYEVYCVSDNGTLQSAPSNIVTVLVISTSSTTIETALYSILIGDATVLSLIDTRVYPGIVPPGADMPAVTYSQISGDREHVGDGPVGLVDSKFQFNCWAKNYGESRTLADAVRQALDGFTGVQNTVLIQTVMLELEVDIDGDRPQINELHRFGKALDFRIWFNETP